MFPRFIHVVSGISFFLLLSKFLLYKYTIFVYIFIHWWIFPIWGLISNAAVTVRYKFLCGHKISFFLSIYLGMGLMNCVVALFNILKHFQTLSKLLHHVTVPWAMHISNFSIFLTILVCLFYYSHLSRYKVVPNCSLGFHFSNNFWAQHLSMCLLVISMFLRNVYSNIFNWVICHFIVSCWVFYAFQIVDIIR